MNYERIKMENIHPTIKRWLVKFLETDVFFIIDAIFDQDEEVFYYLILPAAEKVAFKLKLNVFENGDYEFKRCGETFKGFSLTDDKGEVIEDV